MGRQNFAVIIGSMFPEEKLFAAVPPMDGGESSQVTFDANAVDIQAQQFAKLSIDEMVST